MISNVGNVGPGQHVETHLHGLPAHHFAAIRPRIDVAVPAGLVAQFPHVHLQHLDAASPQRKQAIFGERFLEGLVLPFFLQHLKLILGFC